MAAKPAERVFPPAIEALYGEEMHSVRLAVLRKRMYRAVLIYNSFLLTDFLLLPNTFLLAAILHLGVVTPIIFLIGFLYPRLQSQRLREVTSAAIPFMMVAQIMFIYALNRGQGADHYQYLATMIVIYMNLHQRFAFPLAAVSTCLLMAIYLAVLLPGHSAFAVKYIGTALMLATAYLSLLANRRMEGDVRHAFLMRLRDQLRREGAEEVAKRDPLTGLGNRRYLGERVETLWALGDEAVSPVAIIMIDIDHFKSFNDRYGHGAGDTCLKRVAGAIAAELRGKDDIAARLGGEEFLMLLPRTDLSGAVRIAERVRRQIENLAIPHEDPGGRGVVTVSLGVMADPVSVRAFGEAAAGADAALYAAKHNGRNQVWPPFVATDNPVVSLYSDEAAGGLQQQAQADAPAHLRRPKRS